MFDAKIAVIGSCVCDVIIKVPQLPRSMQDLHIESQTLSLGGCAYNVANILDCFQVPYVLFAPIGQGIYGDFVRDQLKNRQMSSLIDPVDAQNGCCYCLVEPDGERTFLSLHGAEYRFEPEWFQRLDAYPINSVYLCGLEIEEKSGAYILDYLRQHPQLRIYFAPGPRLHKIAKERMKELFDLHAILHVNAQEAISYTGKQDLHEAATALYQLSKAPLIITMGHLGALLYDQGGCHHIPSSPTTVIDTIGAGDAHIGTIIAARYLHKDWRQALTLANQVAGAVVAQPGAALSKERFAQVYDFT